ncbi:hypothetical protein E2493_10060 [Sphingomonas parva]|uniref:MarR family transcriptional regulator n=1 Tax=Sphingomonas parva TaxID=2555898 RepID=A0A4Y8ZSQ2_9SPHN|nr:hypothetical protein [Sphingomonas parva]TFI58322.1 hypothetical protein E2493_10060 [Sphingomonas parva]
MATREDVSRFIRSSFRSVWSFELLLLLKADHRRWSHAEIVAGLRGSDLVVTQSVENLTAAGLVDVDESGAVSYTPVSEREAELVDEAERFYASRPDQVRRMIVAASASGLAAFADAFRIRKD